MNRPTARKSSLGQAHPAVPKAPEVEQVAQAEQTTQRPQTRGPRASARTKMTFYTTAEQAGQVRAVLANVASAQHGYRNVSEFLDAAVTEKVQAMQDKYNQGKPWPPADAGTVARGRPTE